MAGRARSLRKTAGAKKKGKMKGGLKVDCGGQEGAGTSKGDNSGKTEAEKPAFPRQKRREAESSI